MKTFNAERLAALVRNRRTELRWTTEELKEKSGVSNARINQIENASLSETTGTVRQPRPKLLKALAKALRIDANLLLDAAGYKIEGTEQEMNSEDTQMLFFFRSLPLAERENLLVIAEALYHKVQREVDIKHEKAA